MAKLIFSGKLKKVEVLLSMRNSFKTAEVPKLDDETLRQHRTETVQCCLKYYETGEIKSVSR